MIRRSFLQTGSLGLLGLTLPASVSAAISQRATGVANWFQQLATFSGAFRRTAFWGHPPALQQQIHRINAQLAVNGFVSRDASLFFYPDQPAFCFYPLVLRRASAGLTDWAVPVLRQNPDGSWQQVVVLSGYQLEALARASAALADQEATINELLLPAGSPVGASIPTRRGCVVIETRIQQGSVITSISVQDKGIVVYSDQFVSEHCLSVSKSVA